MLYAVLFSSSQFNWGYWYNGILLFLLLPIFLHLCGCGFLFLFEKTAHPWRHLGKERESHCWGKLQGTRKGIEAESTIWDQENTTASSSGLIPEVNRHQRQPEEQEEENNADEKKISSEVDKAEVPLKEVMIGGAA